MNLESALEVYISESRELLQDMEEQLLKVEQQDVTDEMLNAIFRAAHTIKGSAGLFGLDPIVTFTHAVEELLDAVRNHELALDPALVNLLLECHDHTAELISRVDQNDTLTEDDLELRSRQLINRLQQVRPGKQSVPETNSIAEPELPTSVSDWHIVLRFGINCFRDGMDPSSFVRYLSTIGTIIRITPLLDRLPTFDSADPEDCHLGFDIHFRSDADKNTIESAFDFIRGESEVTVTPLTVADAGAEPEENTPQPQQQPEAATAQRPKAAVTESNTLRVDAARLDELVNLVGELIIATASMSNSAGISGQNQFIEAASVVSHLVEEVRDSALSLRMIQIGSTFSRFHRVVRDACNELDKQINLVITGADTELDKTVIEKITDPLTHLVRNAIDHGIETPEKRKAKGKPATGTIRLNAFHESGHIVIEVSDDGAGLNAEKIRQKAIQKGLVGADQQLEESKIFDLIFMPGFSTADQISNLSGRGVGMDVVRRNIEALRGSIQIDSKLGQGTKMSVRVPLTLAIINGFLMGVGSTSLVAPLEIVKECVELPAKNISESKDDHFINLRGELLPYIDVRSLFGIEGPIPNRQSIVVIKVGDVKAGLVVDKLMGELQTVIKPLGNIFRQVKGIGGSTILGSGQVALILDIPNLLGLVGSDKGRHSGQAA